MLLDDIIGIEEEDDKIFGLDMKYFVDVLNDIFDLYWVLMFVGYVEMLNNVLILVV